MENVMLEGEGQTFRRAPSDLSFTQKKERKKLTHAIRKDRQNYLHTIFSCVRDSDNVTDISESAVVDDETLCMVKIARCWSGACFGQ
jgi:hypothetical protein